MIEIKRIDTYDDARFSDKVLKLIDNYIIDIQN